MFRKALGAFFVLALFTVILNSITFVSASSSEAWVQRYGGNDRFSPGSFVQASDGGFLVAVITDSGAMLLKIDSKGDLEWNQTYGDIDSFSWFVESSNGGYVLVSGKQLFKTDAYGNMEWSQTYGGAMPTPEPTPTPEPFPTTWIAPAIVITAIGGAAFLVYFKKSRKQHNAHEADCFGGASLPSMGKCGDLKPHASWKGERTRVGLDSRKGTSCS